MEMNRAVLIVYDVQISVVCSRELRRRQHPSDVLERAETDHVVARRKELVRQRARRLAQGQLGSATTVGRRFARFVVPPEVSGFM